jgi:hypothetical protein
VTSIIINVTMLQLDDLALVLQCNYYFVLCYNIATTTVGIGTSLQLIYHVNNIILITLSQLV